MNFFFFMIIFSSLFISNIPLKADINQSFFKSERGDKAYEIIEPRTILIYRKPPQWDEYLVCGTMLALSGGLSYLTYRFFMAPNQENEAHYFNGMLYRQPRRNDSHKYMSLLGTSVVFIGGAYMGWSIHDRRKKLDSPLIILDAQGIWYESSGFVTWESIEGYNHIRVYDNASVIDEYIEFEKKDGSKFKIKLFSRFDSVIAISKYKFCEFVDQLMREAKGRELK